ncbi:MAG: YccF domain-containing protein [Actinobacteria bacterium]|nr:YccF domain-containing protein [Actinomycetota bacterium]
MRLVLNVVWLVLSGIWLALGYVIAAILMAITIIGIPFAAQALKLAGYALWPFGRTLVPSPGRSKSLSVIGNGLWFVLAGWWLALAHLFPGILLCITIIGIPLGVASFKMAGAALVPFGKEVVELSALGGRVPEDAIPVAPERARDR